MLRRLVSPCLRHRPVSRLLHTNQGAIGNNPRETNSSQSALFVAYSGLQQEVPRLTKVECDVQSLLTESVQRLRLGHSTPTYFIKQNNPQKQEYILPTLQHHYIYKKTILDPVHAPKRYELPTSLDIPLEKFTPGLDRIVPIEDPNPLQKIIDQGVDIRKEAAVLVQIRRRKMKKHQKKKWKKRMKFKLIARKHVVRKRQEKRLREYENQFSTLASEFNAENFVDERLALARKGGWSIDIWAEKRKKTLEG